MSLEKITLLDCTLRDGGYYNAWNFEPRVVRHYLKTMAATGVDVVELGFRFFPQGAFFGAHAFTSDEYLRSLDLPAGPRYAVMVNAAEFVNHAGGSAEAARTLFKRAADSPVSLVRIAAHYRELKALEPAIHVLAELGYGVGLNLMQASQRNAAELEDVAVTATRWAVEVLYFADSLGNMEPADVANVIGSFKKCWAGPLGIHTHDNMLRALANSTRALTEGTTWVDATVLGMGRGPGNVRLEYLLLEMNRFYDTQYNLGPLMDLLATEFEPMQRQFGWGPHPLYYMSGTYGIHPTYVQEMMADKRYGTADILTAMQALHTTGRQGKYRIQDLRDAMQVYGSLVPGRGSAKNWARGRDVLLVANGEGARDHAEELARFVARDKPLVVALNAHAALPANLIDAWAACHPMRLAIEAKSYGGELQPLIAPVSALPADIQTLLAGVETIDYGIEVSPGRFEIADSHCTLPRALAAAYALAFASAAGAQRILLAGFDGFGGADPRQNEMAEIFSLYQKSAGAAPLLAVTPTTYLIPQGSVYAPNS